MGIGCEVAALPRKMSTTGDEETFRMGERHLGSAKLGGSRWMRPQTKNKTKRNDRPVMGLMVELMKSKQTVDETKQEPSGSGRPRPRPPFPRQPGQSSKARKSRGGLKNYPPVLRSVINIKVFTPEDKLGSSLVGEHREAIVASKGFGVRDADAGQWNARKIQATVYCMNDLPVCFGVFGAFRGVKEGSDRPQKADDWWLEGTR